MSMHLGAYFLFTTSVGWQHCAGMQSSSALQYFMSAGGGDAVAVGDGVGVTEGGC
jgi:hypothetical protein